VRAIALIALPLAACLDYGSLSTQFHRSDASAPSSDTGGTIPKTGPPYTGPRSDPGLDTNAVCPDLALEPNDTPATALTALLPSPDTVAPKITKMAICPTGKHDRDDYRIDTTGLSPVPLFLMVRVFYDITFGDLDVAILDANGNVLAADGTAETNACVTTSIGEGVYYAVVRGANDVDVNRYDVQISSYTSSQACP
jgi:hypothetical protein